MAEEQTSEQAAKGGKAKKNSSPKKGGALTADAIFAVEDVKKEKLDIPEWNGYVWVHGLSSGSHEKLVQSCMKASPVKGGEKEFDMIGYQSKLVVLCTKDDDGNRIFDDAHVAKVMEKSSGIVTRIAQKAQSLSGIGQAAVEEIKENLGETTSSDSLSA